MKNANADHVVIPGGMTSHLQALEVVISKPFKDYLWRPYNDLLPKGCHARTVQKELILTAWGRFPVSQLLLDSKSDASPMP
jgi:hypothetical protein